MTMLSYPMLHGAAAMSGFQARLARLALRLTFADAAKLCGTAVGTIQRVEADDENVTARTLKKIKAAYEKEGVEFSADGRGIKLGKPR
jgi:transcriptional regulator with XRE-family HTH domain